MARLRQWTDGVWIAEAPLRFFGFPFGARMTVVRLSRGGLLLHSPIAIDASLREEIAELGAVEHVVAPNKLHHLHLASARAAFPGARFYAPPGLRAKRPDLAFEADLGDAAAPEWSADLESSIVRGSPIMQESVLFHRASRTLIVADLCEHFGPHSALSIRILTRLARMYDRPRMPPDWQWSFRDRAATRASFERLLAWDFDRVMLAHGRLLGSGAKAIFRRETRWAVS